MDFLSTILRRNWKWQALAAAALATLSAVLFIRRALHALWILPFGDETGHIVGGRVLGAGGILYRDFIDAHGPVIYILAQASDMLPWVDQPGAARLVVLLAMLATTVSIAASPCLSDGWERMCAVSLFLGLSTSLWIVQALCMLDYQPVAGMLLAVGCAQFTFPAWCGVNARLPGMVAAGAAFALVPFVAYSYTPSAILLVASGAIAPLVGTRSLRHFGVGAFAALAVFGGWMLLHCDLPGYLAYHFILNQFYFISGMNFHAVDILFAFRPRATPDRIAQSMSAAICLLGWFALGLSSGAAACGARRACMLICGLLGMALSNPRGSPVFQDGAFVLLAFASAAIGWARLPRALHVAPEVWPRICALVVFVIAIVAAERTARAARTSPHGYTHDELVVQLPVHQVQSDADWARRLRQAVRPGEAILALPFAPNIYIEAGRLPMSGFDNYFPWDAEYGRHPWLGRGRDICAALRRAPPPVIFDNEWVVWGEFSPKDYMPCVEAVLSASYERTEPGSFFYVRRDRISAWNK